MIKFLKIFGFGKKIKEVIKPSHTVISAKYNTLSPVAFKKENALQLIYDYKTQIPAQYLTPEFKSYMSISTLKKQRAREIKAEKIRFELEKQEKIRLELERQEKIRTELFESHEKAVKKILIMKRAKHKLKDYDKHLVKLTDPDMCLKLLDYDNNIVNSKYRLYRADANKFLFKQIAKAGKSPQRAAVLLDRLESFSKLKEVCIPAPNLKDHIYDYIDEVQELTNAIMHIGNENQLSHLAKILEEDSFVCLDLMRGVIDAAQDIPVPKEIAAPAKRFLKRGWELPEYAAQLLSHLEGNFDAIKELMKKKPAYNPPKRPLLYQTDRTLFAGFRSALKDGKLDEFKQLVFDPNNIYFHKLIPKPIKSVNPTRTLEEENLYKKEILAKLLDGNISK